ncbi:MAG TPA: PAS domain S-box protein [Acidimicrobiales bacterium]|nr:PAS domain S-box protein [Acidimicrobiales bacterium]
MTDGSRQWQHAGAPDDAAPPSSMTEPTDEDLAAFLELSTEIFGVFALDEGLVWVSPAAAIALGYDPGTFADVDLTGLLHPEDAPLVESLVGRLADGTEAAAATARYRHLDGSWRSFEWTARLEPGTGLVAGVARDVTARQAARRALRTSEARLQAILDHSTAAVFVKDLQGRFVLVNDAFLRPLGLSRVELVGKTSRELWPNSSALADDRDMRVVESGVAYMHDDVLHLVDGPHTLMTVRFPLRDDESRVVGMAAIATDITERKRVEMALAQRERLLDTIVRASPDIVTILDGDGTVTEISAASNTILGYDPDTAALEPLLHADDLPAIYEGYTALLQRTIDHLAIRYRVQNATGEWVTLDTRAEAVVGDDGRTAGAVAVSRDITADLELDEQLRAAVAAAEQASSTKSDFLSRMSHELRTPLNSVLGFAQLLEMDDLPVEQAEAVGHIMRAGHHLLDLIDEVLDIARIESGRLTLSVERVRLDDVVRDAVDLTRPLAEHAGVSVTVDLSGLGAGADGTDGGDRGQVGHVAADRQRLLQVLLNLLSNAVKYNHRDGRVEVVATRAPGERILIAVTDTGAGIRPEDLDRVFDPFDRLGAEKTSVQGTGVGLTLSKHLVERMGGSVVVASEHGVGSTFTVELAAVDAPSAQAPVRPAAAEVSSAAGSLHVLHVEDNPANLALVEQVLARRRGVELQAAMYGSLALELARANHPDLILLDLHLPDMLGTEVFDRLQAEPGTAGIPVVVVSADATPTQVDRLLQAGVAGYLTKPIDVRELLSVVERVSAGEQVA